MLNNEDLVSLILHERLGRKTDPGIYFIYCYVNKRLYVGSSTNISKRISKHMQFLRENRHENQRLQHSYNKYGESTFIWGVLENTKKEDLVKREQWWFDNTDCCNEERGFNICKVASSSLGYKHTDVSKEKMRKPRSHVKYSDERRATIATQARKNFLGSKAHNATLTEDKVRVIKEDLRDGLSYKQVAEKYDSNTNIIGKIARGERWIHVNS